MATLKIVSQDRSAARWVRQMWALAQRVSRSALDVCFPPRCVACDAELEGHDAGMLCDTCRAAVLPPGKPGCRRCGAFAAAESGGKCLCCRDFSLAFDTVVPLGLYAGTLREHVLAMKHPSATPLATAMGGLLTAVRAADLSACRPDVVVPVPMYWSRRFARATNCPEAVASALGRQLALPVHADWIYRQRSTPTQNNLGPRARFRNVRGAFSTRKQLSLNGLRALVVDDVLTTGATASEVAKTLKAARRGLCGRCGRRAAQGPDRM